MKEIVNLKAKLAEKILNEGLGSSEENSWNEDQQREKKLLKISQTKYVEKVLKRFNMLDAKSVNVLLGGYFKPSKAHILTTGDENAFMSDDKLENVPLRGHFKLSKTHSDDRR